MPANDGSAFPYQLDNPEGPAVYVAGVAAMEPGDYSGEGRWTFIVEACFGLSSDIGAQKLLDDMLSAGGIQATVAADETPSGVLFSRLDENGTLTEDQPAAASSVAFIRYRGQRINQYPNGVDMLVGAFEIEVLA